MNGSATAVHAVRSEDPVLRAAAELFYARGIAAVSVQDIRARAGASLKSMYARYPSKEHLVAAYLRRTHEVWMQELGAAIDAAGASTDAATVTGMREAQIAAIFTWLKEWFSAPDFAGCGIANTRGQALGEQARQVVAEHVAQLEQLCTDVIGQGDGESDREAGRTLFLLVEGAIATAAATGDPGFAARAHSAARRVLS